MEINELPEEDSPQGVSLSIDNQSFRKSIAGRKLQAIPLLPKILLLGMIAEGVSAVLRQLPRDQ
jgi:hypothetical protein